jgi:hypothetical protein
MGRGEVHTEFGWETRRKDTSWNIWHRFEDNIKGNLKEIRWEGGDWIILAQGREQVVGCCESGNEPPVSIK